MVSEMARAIHEGQLHLEYQAVTGVADGEWRAVEALLRWKHPRRGRLQPLSFVGVLDHPTVGVLVARQVLLMATDQAATWRAADIEVSVAVNVAPAILPAAVELVAEALEVSGLAPDQLTIEVTERRSPLGARSTRKALLALAHLGVRISLDDFGVDDAGLSRLQLLHFDEIKIDRSFVTRLDTDPTDRTICRFLTDLAHELGSEVVAEGVERGALLDVISDLGVDLVQGFAIHRPEAPESLGRHLHDAGAAGEGRRSDQVDGGFHQAELVGVPDRAWSGSPIPLIDGWDPEM
ncbi:MAG TPA: EAL domain-containing protein [Acidimicrobiales bacterium]|nr:EAL domain-containing protein [Acidimicrobiales bacterium]